MASPQKAVRLTAIAVGAVYAGALYLAGVTLDGTLKSGLAYLPAIATGIVLVFDKWAWRWPLVKKLHNRPRLDGLWLTGLTPDAQSHIPEGGNWGPIKAYVSIEQSFWSISVTQFTAESASHSRAAVFIPRTESRRSVLSFTYDNLPSRAHLSRSPRHVGACEFEVAGTEPKNLTAIYFTGRFTAGDMTLSLLDRSQDHADFAACEARESDIERTS